MKLTPLEALIVLTINGQNENYHKPTLADIWQAIGAQVREAVERLTESGLIEVKHGGCKCHDRYTLAAALPAQESDD